MIRGIAWRRKQNKRIIKKRLGIIHNVWHSNMKKAEGFFSKYNLNCGCAMCHDYKRRNNGDKYIAPPSTLKQLNKCEFEELNNENI